VLDRIALSASRAPRHGKRSPHRGSPHRSGSPASGRWRAARRCPSLQSRRSKTSSGTWSGAGPTRITSATVITPRRPWSPAMRCGPQPHSE